MVGTFNLFYFFAISLFLELCFKLQQQLHYFLDNLFSASIFAYGQTSSGKTYTMSGITEYAVADIYDYMEKVIETLILIFLSFRYAFCYFPRVPLI